MFSVYVPSKAAVGFKVKLCKIFNGNLFSLRCETIDCFVIQVYYCCFGFEICSRMAVQKNDNLYVCVAVMGVALW